MLPRMNSNSLLVRASLLGAVVVITSALSSAHAATKVWTGATNVNWSTGTNWTGGAPANDLTTDVALFNLSTYTNQPTVGTRSVNGIVSGDGVTNTGALVVTTGTGANKLAIGTSGILVNAASGAVTITGGANQGVFLGGSQSFQNDSSNLLTVGLVSNLAGSSTAVTLSLTGTGAGGILITGAIADSGTVGGTTSLTVNKSGGAVTLTTTSTYTGATTINSGTLIIGNGATGSIGSGGIFVTSGTLSGSRAGGNSIASGMTTIGDGVGSADSIINAGTASSSIGRLASGGALTLASDANFVFDLDTTTGLGDQVAVIGATTINSSALFTFNAFGTNEGLTLGQQFVVIDSGTISGQFSNLGNLGFISSNGVTLQANNFTTSGDLILTVTAVPEPGTFAAVMCGLGLLVVAQRFRRRV